MKPIDGLAVCLIVFETNFCETHASRCQGDKGTKISMFNFALIILKTILVYIHNLYKTTLVYIQVWIITKAKVVCMHCWIPCTRLWMKLLWVSTTSTSRIFSLKITVMAGYNREYSTDNNQSARLPLMLQLILSYIIWQYMPNSLPLQFSYTGHPLHHPPVVVHWKTRPLLQPRPGAVVVVAAETGGTWGTGGMGQGMRQEWGKNEGGIMEGWGSNDSKTKNDNAQMFVQTEMAQHAT